MTTSYTSRIHSNFDSNVTWGRNNCDFSLKTCEVHVWNIAVPEHFQIIFKKHRSVLSNEEYNRAKKFYWAHDFRNFVTGRIALRLLIGNYLSLPAPSIKFEPKYGKPRICSQSSLKYSISYADENILISFSGCETGVDIENIKPNFNFDDLLLTCFSESEIAVIKNKAESSASEFYLQWTRKEAILKFTGQGIIDDLTEVPSLNGTHLLTNTDIALNTSLSLRSFNLKSNCVGSIAYPASISEVKHFEW